MKAHHVPIESLPGHVGRHAFNCSIVDHQNKTKLFYRYEPSHGFDTEIGMVELGADLQPIPSTNKRARIIRQSDRIVTVDDPRAIVHDGKLLVVHAQGALPQSYQWASSVCVAEVDNEGMDINRWLPKYGNNSNYATNYQSPHILCEKNWSPFSTSDGLGFVYMINPLIVIKLDLKTGAVGEVSRSEKLDVLSHPLWRWGDLISGGTPLMPWRPGYLAGFFHTRTQDKPGKPDAFTYHVGFFAMTATAPHRITHVSHRPLMTASPGPEFDLRPAKAPWRPNVVYPCGWLERGGQVLLSAGWQDCRCVIYELSWDEILKDVVEIKEAV